MLGIFITAGHPSKEKSIRALQILDDAEIDLIEFGVPFSDPLMDGPTIQKSSFEALESGVNIDVIFEIIQEAKTRQAKKLTVEHGEAKRGQGLDNLILFSAFNPLYAYGFDKLISKFKEFGVRGALIPDLPLDEAESLRQKFSEHNMDLVLLVAPTTNKDRAKKICENSNPFVYLVSRVGTTGVSENFDNNKQLKDQIAELKELSNKTIGVGFGIDSPEKVKQVLAMKADMAIIGSKAVQELADDKSENLDGFRDFIQGLKN